ncbi:MAG: hypothetical protein U0228_00555 [Myxococcaceae bacterium]
MLAVWMVVQVSVGAVGDVPVRESQVRLLEQQRLEVFTPAVAVMTGGGSVALGGVAVGAIAAMTGGWTLVALALTLAVPVVVGVVVLVVGVAMLPAAVEERRRIDARLLELAR